MKKIPLCVLLGLLVFLSIACRRENNPPPLQPPTNSAPTAATASIPMTTDTPSTPIIQIQDGALQGSLENNLRVFKGIPYAAPPVGDLRWREPQPVQAWDDVRDATQFGDACTQPKSIPLENAGSVGAQSEDCLFLNVWTPDARPDAKLPVMVWIHGGALVLGAGSLPLYDGSKLAERGAVVVTLNYRLGPLGFFAHPALSKENPDTPLNFGLLDEIAALQWVQKNIAAFGGDPNNVTIFGESAGAQSVLALFSSPLARGLFQRGIAESAYGIPSHTRTQAQKVAAAVASAVGLNGADATVQELRAVPAEKFAALQSTGTSLAPSFIAGDNALPQPILDAFQKGQEAPVPLIIGNNSNEATVAIAFGLDPAKLIERMGLAKIALKPLYPGVQDNSELGRLLIRDLIFTAFTKRIADLHATRAPTYRYYFEYLPQAMRAQAPGVSHGGEIVFVFDNAQLSPLYKSIFTQADFEMAQRVGAYWHGFAATGKPDPQGEPAWTQSNKANDAVMVFGDTIAMQQNFMKQRLDVFVELLNLVGKFMGRE